jgi:hypothetical protein
MEYRFTFKNILALLSFHLEHWRQRETEPKKLHKPSLGAFTDVKK